MTAATMPTEASQLPRLIQMAEAMGCQLRPSRTIPGSCADCARSTPVPASTPSTPSSSTP